MDRAEQLLRIVTFSVLLLSGLWYIGSGTIWEIVKLRGQAFNLNQAARSCQIELRETNKLLAEARDAARNTPTSVK